MRKVRDTLVGFRRPADFSITNHLSDSFGVFTTKGRHRIRIRFDAFAAQLVSERQWHPSQKIERLADGELELSMTLGGLEEIERWIMSWGTHATVVEPAAMVRRIRHTVETLGRRYVE